VSGRIIVQQEKISRAERSWTSPLNALQEAIYYACIKFCKCTTLHLAGGACVGMFIRKFWVM
jgi:hypothetical protein